MVLTGIPCHTLPTINGRLSKQKNLNNAKTGNRRETN
jgi:hypothetical protein